MGFTQSRGMQLHVSELGLDKNKKKDTHTPFLGLIIKSDIKKDEMVTNDE